jgi:hypothetical protein
VLILRPSMVRPRVKALIGLSVALLVPLMALARLVETAHLLTDVAGGVSTGVAVTLGAALLLDRGRGRAAGARGLPAVRPPARDPGHGARGVRPGLSGRRRDLEAVERADEDAGQTRPLTVQDTAHQLKQPPSPVARGTRDMLVGFAGHRSDLSNQPRGLGAAGAPCSRGWRRAVRVLVVLQQLRGRWRSQQARRRGRTQPGYAVRGVQGPCRAGPGQARRRQLQPGVPPQRHRLRRLPADAVRHRAEQPHRLGHSPPGRSCSRATGRPGVPWCISRTSPAPS